MSAWKRLLRPLTAAAVRHWQCNVPVSTRFLSANFSNATEPNAAAQKKRFTRKRRLVPEQNLPSDLSPSLQVVACSTAEEYNLLTLQTALKEQGLYIPTAGFEDVLDDVLHVTAKYLVGQELRQIYFFQEGSIVFWNVPELERSNVLQFVRPHEHSSHDEELVWEESETMTYSYSETNTKARLVNDRVVLTKSPGTHLEMYTFSNAMARSVNLGIWEATLDLYADNIEHVVEELKRSGKVKLTQKEVSRKTGELFALRHMINLSSDLLSTPDFFWDRENLEALHKKMCNHLNLARRTSIMNEKLNYCTQLVELLTNHLRDEHHVRLELMIIALILIEVLFALVHVVPS